MEVYIETYGCSANQNNSEIMAGLLKNSGYNITNNQKIADILILNTCIVKNKTENKIKRRIQDLRDSKKLIIITGCMPDTDSKQIKKLNPRTILLGTHHFKEIINLIRDYKHNLLDEKKQESYISKTNEEKILLPKIPQNPLISIIQISEGCLGKCTYCKTRLAKGKLFSYNKDKIIKTIKNDLNSGAKEVWITSQDNGLYGLDKKNNYLLPNLLKDILNINKNFKIRIGMTNPNSLLNILDDMIEIYKNPKIYKFLHIPIQSASNSVLKHMKRPYQLKDVEKIITKFKKEIPNLVLATDLIIGYPTENEKDHKKNLKFIEKFKPDVLNISKMSIHKGTEIYDLVEQGKTKPIDIKIINKRTTELMNLHRKTALENKTKSLNKILKVFVNKKISQNFYEARDDFYNIVLINSKEKILGKTLEVKIKQVGVHHLIGLINNS